MAGRMAGRMSGSVMLVSCCHQVAPSIEAASYVSEGTDCRAPRMTIMKNGYENQVSAATMAANAVVGFVSQLSPLILNSAFKTWLMVPCSRKKNCQTSAIKMASDEAAQGMKS